MLSFLLKKPSPSQQIGILYICTGKYHIFWKDFYKSSKRKFCRKSDVHYFVFTDYPISTFDDPKVHHIPQPRLGWPHDTLKRFHMFLDNRSVIQCMDYLFFFNANMVFCDTVTEEEILPYSEESGLVSVMHPYFYDHDSVAPFEDNQESMAFVDADRHMDYFQGCLSGGRAAAYLSMGEEIRSLVDCDLDNGLIAKWHDESYMNKYFQAHPPRALSPSYAFPEGVKLPFRKKIVQLDKARSGGHEFLRR